MSTVITHSSGVITPTAVDGYESARTPRTIVHTILGRSDPDITLRPAGLRSGTLTLVFATGAEASGAEAVLRTPEVFALTNPDVPEMAMSFVVAEGDLRTVLGDTRQSWNVDVPFREVGV